MRVTRSSKPSTASTGAILSTHLAARSTESSAKSLHIALCVSALLLSFSTGTARAQDLHHARDYTSIVVFGDSLSDTGNVAHLTQDKYGVQVPGPDADYTAGRFTDGADTLPPAEKYFGVWVEQLAATFPSKPAVKDSLDGGTDYAYGFATTGDGTGVFTFGASDSLSVNVDNVGQQITDYLATNPKITDKTLFVVWGGAIDVLYATSSDDVITAGLNQTLNIQRLIDAGATQFIIPNLPPLGLTPRLNGSSATSVPATAASVLYNEVLSSGVALLREADRGKRLHLDQLDVFDLLKRIVASPSAFSLANVTDSSQGIAVDPDTYLFWDDLHPTTHGHNILARKAAKLLDREGCWDDSASAERSLTNLHADCAEAPADEPAGVEH
jgi:phospholipase/lecithinase/hemolysin